MPTLDNHASSAYTKPKRIIGSLKERFMNYVGEADPTTGCIPWLGGRDKHGYGRINSCGVCPRPLLAHRLALSFSGVRVESQHKVLHSCNNSNCVNPEHLRIGTQYENVRQASQDGLMSVPKKFDADDIAYIKRLKEQGYKNYQIAERVGCSQSYLTKVFNGGLKHANIG